MFAKDYLHPISLYDEESAYTMWWTEVWNIWAEKIHPEPESKELQIFLDMVDENWCEKLWDKGYTPQESAKIIQRGKNIFFEK
jgi:hypothetical protein